ncbi:MAG: hypothetical protein E7262_10685 [Lachnospiraceae bacterium]|nr:hypothetical protein [Lachnospiraceae bacterium]
MKGKKILGLTVAMSLALAIALGGVLVNSTVRSKASLFDENDNKMPLQELYEEDVMVDDDLNQEVSGDTVYEEDIMIDDNLNEEVSNEVAYEESFEETVAPASVPKVSKKVTNKKKYTFSLAEWGSCDIKVSFNKRYSSSKPATIKIYKNSVKNSNLITTRTETSKTYTYKSTRLKGKNTYKVEVTVPSKSTIKCEVYKHVDSKNSTKGGVWSINNNSGNPNSTASSDVVETKAYVPAKNVADVIVAVQNDKNLNITDRAITLGATAASTYLATYIPTLSKVGPAIVYGMFTSDITPSLVQSHVSEVKRVSGYSTSTHKAKYGVCVTVGWINRTRYIKITKWDGNKMTGEPGYTGKFKAY